MHLRAAALVVALLSLFTGPAVADVVPIPREPPESPPMKLVPVQAEASCSSMKLVDDKGEAVDVPADVLEALDCPTLAAVDPFGERLIYRSGAEVRIWSRGRSSTLMTLFADGGGTSRALWSPDGTSVAFVSVNQIRYDTSTRLFVLELDGIELTHKHRPARKINFVCGSICGSAAGTDFWWDGSRRVRFRTWEEVPGDLEGQAVLRSFDLPSRPPFVHGR